MDPTSFRRFSHLRVGKGLDDLVEGDRATHSASCPCAASPRTNRDPVWWWLCEAVAGKLPGPTIDQCCTVYSCCTTLLLGWEFGATSCPKPAGKDIQNSADPKNRAEANTDLLSKPYRSGLGLDANHSIPLFWMNGLRTCWTCYTYQALVGLISLSCNFSESDAESSKTPVWAPKNNQQQQKHLSTLILQPNHRSFSSVRAPKWWSPQRSQQHPRAWLSGLRVETTWHF